MVEAIDGGSSSYTNPNTGVGGGQFRDSMGNVDYQDAYNRGGGEKDGGIIGYQKGGLATMFTRGDSGRKNLKDQIMADKKLFF